MFEIFFQFLYIHNPAKKLVQFRLATHITSHSGGCDYCRVTVRLGFSVEVSGWVLVVNCNSSEELLGCNFRLGCVWEQVRCELYINVGFISQNLHFLGQTCASLNYF